MSKQKPSKTAQAKSDDYTLLEKRDKVRMWQINSVLTGTRYKIEVKKWYGCVQPSISYSDDGQFYSKVEADKWFDYLSGNKDKKKLIALA